MMDIALMDHAKLDGRAFVTSFPSALDSVPSPDWLQDLLRPEADAPFSVDDDVRRAVRDMLRTHGYKPSGRGKPASEYLAGAADRDGLVSINAAVDTCNVVSLHSGLPISVVDAGRAIPPLRIDVPEPGATYVFNASGQEIRLDGIPCLFDRVGPCANAVRDSERTKTRGDTVSTITVIWGSVDLPGRAEEAQRWYEELLRRLGATTERIDLSRANRL